MKDELRNLNGFFFFFGSSLRQGYYFVAKDFKCAITKGLVDFFVRILSLPFCGFSSNDVVKLDCVIHVLVNVRTT